MLTVEQTTELLVTAERLRNEQAFPEIQALLGGIPRVDLLSQPNLGYYLASAFHRLGNYDASLELLREMGAVDDQRMFDAIYRSRRNLEGSLLLEFGETAEAETAFLEVIRRTGPTDDQRT